MFKKLFLISLLFISSSVMAQESFWGFDDYNHEMIIPPECDSTFDPDELYSEGIRLLENETGSAQLGAGYCLLSAAFEGHVEAQYRVAVMYHKAIAMPKSDLAAYKWATIAALNGHAAADALGANIEQFLSIQDIEMSAQSLDSLIAKMKTKRGEELSLEKQLYSDTKERLSTVKKEISDLEIYGRIIDSSSVVPLNSTAPSSSKEILLKNRNKKVKENSQLPIPSQPKAPIFSKYDLETAPMPTR